MGFEQALANLVNGLVGPFWKLLFGLAGLIGAIFILSFAGRVMRHNQHPGSTPAPSMAEGAFVFVIAAMLVQMPSFFSHVAASFALGTVSYGAIDYPGAANFGKLAPAINAVLTVASMAGGVFAMRGIYYFHRAATGKAHSGEDAQWKGVTHLFGGIALMQMVQLIEMLRKSTGGLW